MIMGQNGPSARMAQIMVRVAAVTGEAHSRAACGRLVRL